MSKERLEIVHEVPDDERKAFVRNCVHEKLGQLRKTPRRSSKDPRRKICEVIRDVLANTDAGRLHLVAEANFCWQKEQLREFLERKAKQGGFNYKDMKNFIHANGWDEQWIPTKRLQGYWASIARTHRI